MVLEKGQYWDNLVDHYYDNVHWEKGYTGIYEWLEQEYDIISDTGSKVLQCNDQKKATWFIMRHT